MEQINAGLRTQKLQLFYQQLNGLLFGVENLLVIWLGATMVMDGQFSVGILMAFNAYKSQFDSRVGSLIDKFFELRMLQLQGERLADIVLQAPEVSHGDILPENLREREASIEIQGLRYRYAEQEPWVLDGLDLRIAGGESVAIVGPSGCGKSTLFNVLLGILPPVEGQIRMAGLDLAQLGLDGLRELVGTVLQETCCSPVRSATTSVSSTRNRTCPGCCSARRWLPSTMTSRPCRWATTPWSATWARCSPAARSSG